MERRRKDTATEAVAVHQQATLGNICQTDNVVLHHSRIEEILNWTKEHLDAYLASADVIIEQRDEPGLNSYLSPGLPPRWCMRCGSGVIWFWQM
jgi:hypothetical protein